MTKTFTILAALFFMAVQAPNAIGQQSGIKEYEVRYILKLAAINVGKTYAKMSKTDENEYEVVQKLDPGILLKAIGERKSTQTSSIRFDGEKIIPLNFHIKIKKRESLGAKIDWQNKEIVFLNGEIVPMASNDIHDWGSWFPTFILNNPEDLPGKRITVVQDEEVVNYEYGPMERETITVNSELFETFRTRMQDVSRSDRAFTVWISPDHNNLPVKLKRHLKGTTVNIVLDSVIWND